LLILHKFKGKNKMDMYSEIEKAKKSGKIEKGINEVTKAIERGTAKLVVVASDVDPKEIIAHIKPLCEEKKVKYEEVESKQKLGLSAGINVPCTAVAVVEKTQTKK